MANGERELKNRRLHICAAFLNIPICYLFALALTLATGLVPVPPLSLYVMHFTVTLLPTTSLPHINITP